MITLDGIDYVVQTPIENTMEMINYVNNYCAEKQVTNRKGEIIFIEATNANPLFLLFYGFGYLLTIIEQLLYHVGASFNISAASDRQLLNLAHIAKMDRKAPTATTIHALIYASLDTPCHITQDLIATARVGNTNIQFYPAFEATIPVDGVLSTVLIASTPGTYNIAANTIVSFDTNPAGFLKMTTEASVPGTEEESIQDLRVRLQEKSTEQTQLDRCANAITSLPGVSLCSIYFNYNIHDSITIDNTQLPPRTAMLFVQGFSNDIARTFYQYLSVLTYKDSAGRSIQQDYTTGAGQHIPVYIIPPTMRPVYFRIYVSRVIESAESTVLQDAIMQLAGQMKIGASLTTPMIIRALQDAPVDVGIRGVEVSFKQDLDYQLYITPSANELIQFIRSNISFIAPSLP